MNRKSLIVLVASIVLVLALVVSACGSKTEPTPSPSPSPSPSPTPTGGVIEVISVHTEPVQVTAGDPATVTVELKNYGGSEAIYSAKLLVNGVEEQAKNVTLAAGASGTATFTLVKDAAATYTISVGGLTSILIVKAKPVETPTPSPGEDGGGGGGGEEEPGDMG